MCLNVPSSSRPCFPGPLQPADRESMPAKTPMRTEAIPIHRARSPLAATMTVTALAWEIDSPSPALPLPFIRERRILG
jgi:hypothetical protein